MNLLGFSFSKIGIERLSGKAEQLKVGSSINILDIKSSDVGQLKLKEDVLEVKFAYSITYDPDYAKVDFAGNIFVSVEPKLSKEILKEWKDKKLNEELKVFVFNLVLKKATIKALQLEDEINLPSHLPLPSVKPDSEQSQSK